MRPFSTNLKSAWLIFCVFGLSLCCLPASDAAAQSDKNNKNPAESLKRSVAQLIKIQEQDGAWPYEGVYRVRRQIPVGYRVGGTAIVCTALLYSAEKENSELEQALTKGVKLILKELKRPEMRPSIENRYDVRVWGHIYALDLFCRIANKRPDSELHKLTKDQIQGLVDILLKEEIRGGGWNYANQRSHACFVTAPAVQALLWARSLGANVPDDVFQRSANVLKKSRNEDGAYQYSGTTKGRRPALLPGSIARGAICESTLILLGEGKTENLQGAIEAFHEHWDELEKRRKKTGTHKPPYGVAPYYFYYGHRYLAQAIQILPKKKQDAAREKFNKVLMKTQDADGTWNDRVFDRSKAYGTAMSIQALRSDVPVPPGLQKEKPKNDKK